MVSVSLLASPWKAQAQGPRPAPEKKERKAKDQAEEDLLFAVKKEPDSNKKIALLKQWKEKYPDSDYKSERLLYFLDSYAKLGDSRNTVDAAKEILAEDPQNTQAILGIAINVFGLSPPTGDDLSLANTAANHLLANLDSTFGTANKPAFVSDPAWKQTRIDVEGLAHAVLGWIAMQRKENETAEQQFLEALQ